MSGFFGLFGKSEPTKTDEEKKREDEEKKRDDACEEEFKQCKSIPVEGLEVVEKLKTLRGGRRKSKSNRRRKTKSKSKARKSRRSRK
jgi:hypothetical protein